MPTQALQKCSNPGCPTLVRSGRCPACSQAARPSQARFYTGGGFYGRRWREARRRHLAEHPFCEECLRETPAKHVPADELDHKVPHRGNHALFWDPTNWQGLCRTHHARKTAREVWHGTGAVARFVVCGPPGAGKTTWVNGRRTPGDLVWDMDAICAALALVPRFPRPPHVQAACLALRNALVQFLVEHPALPAYLIIGDPDEADAVGRLIAAQTVRLPYHPAPRVRAP